MVLCLLWNAIAVHLILNDSEVSPRHPPPPHTATSVASSVPCEGSFPSSLPLASSQWPRFHSRFAPNSSDISEALIKTRLRNDSFSAERCYAMYPAASSHSKRHGDGCLWVLAVLFQLQQLHSLPLLQIKGKGSLYVGAQLVVFLNWLAVQRTG